jgi:hypothetical protein
MLPIGAAKQKTVCALAHLEALDTLQGGGKLGRSLAAYLSDCTVGGKTERLSAGALSLHKHRWRSSDHSGDDLMVGNEGLEEQDPVAPSRPKETGGTHHECHHLVGGPKPGRQHFTIHIQKRHYISRRHAVQHRLCAYKDLCAHHLNGLFGCDFLIGGPTTDLDHRPTGCRLEFLAQSGHSGTEICEGRATACPAHAGTLLSTSPTHQHPSIIERKGGFTVFASDQLLAASTGQQFGSSSGVGHTHHPSTRHPEVFDQFGAEK